MERDVTGVLLTIDGKKAAVTVAFGEPGEEAVLGATALESLGFLVDPVDKKLLPRKLFRAQDDVFFGFTRILVKNPNDRWNRWNKGPSGCVF